MAKFRTLDLTLTNLQVVRVAAGIYQHSIEVTDWDDGVVVTFSATLDNPIIAVSAFKLRIQIEQLEETPALGPPSTT